MYHRFGPSTGKTGLELATFWSLLSTSLGNFFQAIFFGGKKFPKLVMIVNLFKSMIYSKSNYKIQGPEKEKKKITTEYLNLIKAQKAANHYSKVTKSFFIDFSQFVIKNFRAQDKRRYFKSRVSNRHFTVHLWRANLYKNKIILSYKSPLRYSSLSSKPLLYVDFLFTFKPKEDDFLK